MKMKFLSTHIVAAIATLLLAGCNNSTSGPAAPQPFTGNIHEVQMRGTVKKYYYEPAQLIVNRGDKVRFTMVEGGPHNVNFTNQRIPNGAQPILEGMGKLLGPQLQAPGQTWEIEFTKNLPPGDYNFVCDPHTALGMKGKIILNP